MSTPNALILNGTRAERLVRQLASIVIGVVISGAIFTGLGSVQHHGAQPMPSVVDDLHAVALPVQPPPPPTHPDETIPVFDSAAIQLSASRSPDSEVKLPAAPIPSDTVPPVHAVPRFDVSPGMVRPNADVLDRDVQHIFSKADVDQFVMAIYRKTPEVSQQQINQMKTKRATFLMVVGTDGSVTQITLVDSTGSEGVDQACIDALKEWRFKPAVRRGRAVRCWVQQNLIFKVNLGSPFEWHSP